ncbi:polyamine aminopropyltransferase [Angustibacter luteus]|uniref:Spermidine synthase n=1 Tax=Angustibacter luteus TaxID=658456 RepID=A0ABW1JF35_9ACTN
MSARFEELAWRETAMGAISLRRRVEPSLGVDVYEVKLGDEFLMSSLFTVAEVELARRGLGEASDRSLDVVVGGLGLGYTARAALEDPRVSALTVVEALPDVIDWHVRDLVPGGAELDADPRTTLLHADFFALVASGTGFDPAVPGRQWDVVLLDVDHSPRHVLHPSHAAFYTRDGLGRLVELLRPGGIFGLWADGAPDVDFLATLRKVFGQARADVVEFPNFYTREPSASTVYLAS